MLTFGNIICRFGQPTGTVSPIAMTSPVHFPRTGHKVVMLWQQSVTSNLLLLNDSVVVMDVILTEAECIGCALFISLVSCYWSLPFKNEHNNERLLLSKKDRVSVLNVLAGW